MASDWQAGLSAQDRTAVASQPPPAPLSRADIADYLDRANYDPERARTLAAKERLSNLGVAPGAIAQATLPTVPLSAPRQPNPSLQPTVPAVVGPRPSLTAVSRPVAPLKPNGAPVTPKGAIDFSDLGARPVAPIASKSSGKIDFTDLGGIRVNPSTLADTTPMADPGAGKTYQEPETKGPLHQVGGFLQGAGENIAGAVRGVHDLFQGPQNDDEKAIQQKLSLGASDPDNPSLGSRLALAGYRFLHGVNDTMNQMDTAGKLGAKEAKESGSTKAGILTDMENEPFIGNATKLAEQGEYGKSLGDLLTTVLAMRAGGKAREAGGVVEPIEGAPLTAGEAAGPGLRQSAEKLFSKTSTAEKRMGDVMTDRTAAMQAAAEKTAPATTSPETTGATEQNAARDVLDRQQQAQSFVGDLADRAKTEAENAKTAATDKVGTATQDYATRQLNVRRVADVEAGKATAKSLSGVDELPVPETDREIISSLRGANSSAKLEESAAHNELAENAKEKGIQVDPAPMQSVAKDVVGLEGPAKDLVMSSLPASVYRTLEKVAGRSTSEADVIASRAKDFGWDSTNLTDQQLSAVKKDVADHPAVASDPESGGPVPYQTMKTARTAVGEALPSARKHFQQSGMGSNAVRTLQSLYGSMTDAMKNSVADDPALSAQFEKANALTRERSSTFVDPKAIRKLAYGDDPGKVVGSVMRSGSDADVGALRTALDADKTGQGLARAQRGAMDYILRKSAKSATSDLPAGVSPEAVDYDLATRNAKNSPALRTILGDEKYNKFVDDLDAKRLKQRAPDEINLDNQLTKIAKADSPEKAAKIAGYDASTDTGVQAAERKAATASGIRDRMQSPNATESGPQRVAEQVANELEPSKIVERAASSPEYTEKLLSVLDKHPNATNLRESLGKRIFRNASDGAMARGAFGSTDGIFDVEKFQKSYAESRPSLAKVLPPENLAAMDKFNEALNKYALSKGIGGSAGMSGRFMAMRQIFGVLGMARGVVSASPTTVAVGAAASFGPRLWMETTTRPQFTNAVTKALSAGAGAGRAAVAAGMINKAGEDSRDSKQGFQRPEMAEHKTAGMAAAAEAPNTPEHLRPHLRALAGTGVPQKGAIVLLPGGQRATVEYSSPHDRTPVVKVRMDDGKAIRFVGKKEVSGLKSAEQW